MASSVKDSPREDAKTSVFPDEKLRFSAGDERSVEKSDALVTADSQMFEIDHHAERRLVWKFDTRILPVLAVMYLFNSLDKSNLGNAKSDGLEKTLNLVGDQYNIILSVFFVPYVLTAPVLAIAGKKYGPNRVLPIMMLSFGFVTTMVMVVQNFGGLMTIRWFLGMAESAFFPLVIYYQTTYALLSFAEGHLLTNCSQFLSTWGTRSTTCSLLRGPIYRLRVWRPSCVRRISNSFRFGRKLALSFPH